MAVHKCGWCGNSTHMTVWGSSKIGPGVKNRILTETTFSCDECGRLSIGVGDLNVSPNSGDNGAVTGFWREHSPQQWAPAFIEGQSFDHVPMHISEAAGEAHRSFSVNNLKSSILMARTVVEAVAKNQGITTGSLYNKIDAMAEQGTIREFTKQTAHAIRTFGNDMAHGDIEQPVDAGDTEMVLEFMDALLSEVFQTPAKLAALQARVAARNASS